MGLHVPERYRVRRGRMGSDASIGNNGAFEVPSLDGNTRLFVIASDGGDWEHVSVSTRFRTPTWDEMHHIKNMFWDKEDTVIQIHPPQSQYINNCENCLHLWRPLKSKIPLPPTWMIGV